MIAFFFYYEDDEHNDQFEDFIRKWDDIHGKRIHECNLRKSPNNSTDPYLPKFQQRSEEELNAMFGHRKDWAGSADYDVYRLLPTIYYYGYHGSSTTPPCASGVTWRILDIPMKISHDQYQRIQTIILDQRDEHCKLSTKAYNGGVNRPIHEITTQNVYHCDGLYWKPRFPELWCGKWPEDYHGVARLEGKCP